MQQLLFHLFGDFLFQNDWMATNKKNNTLTGYMACLCHCVVYSIPFAVCYSTHIVSCVFFSHFVIDKYALAKYWMRWMKICVPERGAPIWLSVWLTIIVDNTFHLLCNYTAIKYLS